MASNKFYTFAEVSNHILTDEEYEADTQRKTGNQPGIARGKLVNKALKQTSLMTAALAQFIMENQAIDVHDGMSVNELSALLLNAQRMPGEIGTFCFETPPKGWLLADGAAVSRTTYSRLFAAIGTTFGTDDGNTTFNLPDLRGEFIRGWDAGRGVDTGRGLGDVQGDAIRNITGNFGSLTQFSPNGAFVKSTLANAYVHVGDSRTDVCWNNFDASRLVPTARENRPRNVALAMFIFAGI